MTDGRGGLASSDQRWTLGRGPGLAHQPQAAGQTHTQFVTTTRGRALVPAINLWIRWWIPLDHPTDSRWMFFGRSDST